MPPPAAIDHEAPLQLMRQFTEAIAGLLVKAGHAPPPGSSITIADSQLNEPRPSHLAVDLVAMVHDADGHATRVVAIEIQRRHDPNKRWSWPLYAAQLEAPHRVPAVLVVVALHQRVAEQLRGPSFGWPERPFAPIVLGPEELAAAETRPDQAENAAQSPYFRALASLVLAGPPRGKLRPDRLAQLEANLRGTLAELHALPHDQRKQILDLLHGTARSPEVRATLERLLEVTDMDVYEMIRRERRQRARAEGRAEGKAEGRAEGKAEAKAEDLLRLLRRRGFEVSAEREAAVLSTTDLGALDAWFDRAIDARSLDEVW